MQISGGKKATTRMTISVMFWFQAQVVNSNSASTGKETLQPLNFAQFF